MASVLTLDGFAHAEHGNPPATQPWLRERARNIPSWTKFCVEIKEGPCQTAPDLVWWGDRIPGSLIKVNRIEVSLWWMVRLIMCKSLVQFFPWSEMKYGIF